MAFCWMGLNRAVFERVERFVEDRTCVTQSIITIVGLRTSVFEN